MSDLPSQTLQNSGNFAQSPAFADALQRAKQIAAKINPGAAAGQKRALEEEMDVAIGREVPGLLSQTSAVLPCSPMAGSTSPTFAGPDGKRPAAMADPYGAQLAAMRDAGALGGGAPLAIGGMESDEIMVPDRMVGLIIGRGGECINRLQSESGAKIQMAPATLGDTNERVCSLSGARVAIERGKELILAIINSRAGERDRPMGAGVPGGGGMGGGGALVDMLSAGGDQPGQTTAEMMVPGGKVGLIIGKGGETIKQLQDKSGSRMVVIQDGPYANAPEKPLRITGDAQQIEHAKQLVFDLMAEKEGMRDNRFGGGAGGGRGFGGSGGGGGGIEVTVPQAAVGVVIGKGGEMIKKIQNDSGCNIQFQQNMAGRNERVCTLSGSPDQIEHAKLIIHDLIDSVMKRDQMGGPGNGNGFGNGAPRNGGWGGGPGGPGGQGGPGGPFGRGPMGRDGKTEISFPVPANKCGIVIGKGGETIKAINMQTGAHCELDRRPPPNPNEKIFVVKGMPDQVEHAKRLICEKVGIPCGPPGGPGGPFGGPPGPGGPGGYPPQGWPNPGFHNPGVWGQQNEPGKPDGWNNQFYAQFYGGGQGGPGQTAGGPGGQQPQASPAPAVNPQTGQPDYSAQWVQYYRSMGMTDEAEAIERQAKASKAGPGGPTPGGAGVPGGGPGGSQPATNGGQPDYTAQWVEYYRSMGMHDEAEKLETQIKVNKSVGNPGPAAAPAAAAATGPGAPAADYTDQWIAYYKSQGMMDNVAQLEKVKQQTAGGPGQPMPSNPGGAPGGPGGFQPPYSYPGGFGGPGGGAPGGGGGGPGGFGQYGGYPGAGDN